MQSRRLLLFAFIALLCQTAFSQISRTYSTDEIGCTIDANGTALFENISEKREGLPELPVKKVSILLPHDADLGSLSLTLNGSVESEVSSACVVAPAGPAISSNGDTLHRPGVDAATGKDLTVYESNSFYPAEDAKILSVGKKWEYKIVTIALHPYQYNPVTGVLKKNEHISLTLDYLHMPLPPVTEEVPASFLERMNREVAEIEGMDPSSVRNNVSGYPSQSAADTKETFVIMTNYSIAYYSWNLEQFINFKESQGYNVVLATEFQWGGGHGIEASENMRNWLRNNYVDLNIKYVFIIGDPRVESTVPMRMIHPVQYDELSDCPSDFYYADLTASSWDVDGDGKIGEYEEDFIPVGVGPDHYAEVIVGRFPLYGVTIADMSKLDGYLSKVMHYQSETDIAWRERGLYGAPNSNTSPVMGTKYQTNIVIEAIKDEVLRPNNFDHLRLYSFTYPYMEEPHYPECNYEKFSNLWANNAFGIVAWASHGSAHAAKGYVFKDFVSGVISTDEVPRLNNSNPSIVFQGSCSNGTPEVKDNLAYSLLNNGAIATVSATRPSYGWSDDSEPDLQKSDFSNSGTMPGLNYSFNKKIIVERKSVGEAMHESKSRVYPINWENWSNYLMFSIYGDPSISLDDKNHATYTISASVRNDDASPYPLWSTTPSYVEGDTVCYKGHIWAAKWWSQAQAPKQEAYGPWNDLGEYHNGLGVISPAGDITVNANTTHTFTFTPDVGCVVSNVFVNGVSVGTPESYTFSGVLANKNIEVEFSPGSDRILEWSDQRQYYSGDKVDFNGEVWTAKWWSLDTPPAREAYGPWSNE